MGGISIMGYGWSLSTGSTISCTNKSIYYDGETAPIMEADTNAAFSLDGQRLIWLEDNTLQIHMGLTKATPTISNGIITSFKVHHTNGIIADYTLSDGTNFYCTKMTDIYGHTILFNYTFMTDQGHYRLANITYGRNKECKVSFEYQRLPGAIQIGHNYGRRYMLNYSLTKITSEYSSNEWRTYTLNYETAYGNKTDYRTFFLKEICCSAQSQELNPLRFFYNENVTHALDYNDQIPLSNFLDFTDKKDVTVQRGKFIYGSSKDGIVMYPNKESYKYSGNRIINEYTGAELIHSNISIGGYGTSFNAEQGFITTLCMDAGAGPDDELIKINNYVLQGEDITTFNIYGRTSANNFVKRGTLIHKDQTLVRNNSTCPKKFYSGDFNGDGKMEILMLNILDYDNGNSDILANIIDLESGYTSSNIIIPIFSDIIFQAKIHFEGKSNTSADNTDHIYTFDYNADGKTDICLINEYGCTFFTYNPQTEEWDNTETFDILTKNDLSNKQILFGDFHGDGKTSILTVNGYGQAQIYESNGYGLSDGDSAPYIDATIAQSPLYGKICFLQDMDDDGISDIIGYEETSSGYIHITTYYMNTAYNISYTEETVYNAEGEMHLLPVDIQSRNFFCRLLGVGTNGKVVSFNAVKDRTCDKLLTATINSLGILNTFHYERFLNESQAVVTPNAQYSHPYQLYYGGLSVCTQQKIYHYDELYNNIVYDYQKGIIHKQGLGFCGFTDFTATDSITNRIIKNTFNPLRYSTLISDEVIENGVTISQNSYGYIIGGGDQVGANLLLMDSQHFFDKEKMTKGFTIYFFDDYGNPTRIVTEYEDNESPTITKRYTYQNVTGNTYRIGIPTKEIIEESWDAGSRTTTTQYNFSTDWKYLLNKYVYINGTGTNNLVSTETYTYNSHGQPLTQSVTPYRQTTALTTTYTYDTNGRQTSMRDSRNNLSNYYYNNMGLLYRVTNHKGKATLFGYDMWGRNLSATYPDGTSETTGYSWGQGRFLIGITHSATGQPQTTTWSDAFGREIKNEQATLFGTVKTETTYAKNGLSQTTSFPYKNVASKYTTHTKNRATGVVSVTDPLGRNEIHVSSMTSDDTGLYGQITSTVNGLTTTKRYNYHNTLIEATDDGGTIGYTYLPGGLLQEVTIGGVFSTTYTYDNLGRKLSMQDPMAGTITLTYDEAGNVDSETDARNKQKLMEYDQYGRTTLVEYVDELTTTYIYNSDDQLLTESSSNGSGRDIAYDDFSRITRENITIGESTQNLIKYYTYENGNIKSVTYKQNNGSETETSIGTETFYYSYGNLAKIGFTPANSSTEKIVWQPTSSNDAGLATGITSGPLTHTYQYDDYGQITKITTVYNESTIRNVRYGYEPNTGNMLWRTDDTRGFTEEFEYDYLNRLISTLGTNGSSTISGQNVFYDDLTGSITHNSIVGGDYWYSRSGDVSYRPSMLSSDYTNVSQNAQTITYSAMHRPLLLNQNGKYTQFYYNGDGERIRMHVYTKPNAIFKQDIENRYYIDNKYEATVVGSTFDKYLYVGGDAYSAPAVWIWDETGTGIMYYICRDHLGSITHVVRETDGHIYEYSYDAWGNRRLPSTWQLYVSANVLPFELFLRRGFCGHEHLSNYGLINMNARLYEPTVGQFISPDPFVQGAESTQGYNRYSYCLNNPLKYTDESGEFIFSILNFAKELFINTFIKVWDEGINAWTDGDNWHSTKMAFKIDMGLFKGNLKQIVSRFTWELPQNILGYGLAQGFNLFNDVKSVTYYGGATAVERYARPDSEKSIGKAITLGSFISGTRGLQADPYNALFQHEYGHYLQSQDWGIMYLGKVGIPSILSAKKARNSGNPDDHKYNPIEQDANARAFEYFNKNVEGFYENKGWNFSKHPIDITGMRFSGEVDYKKSMDKVRRLRISTTLVEYILPKTISLGLYNHIRYNNIETSRRKGIGW